MIIEIPDSTLKKLSIPPEEVRLEIAIVLYVKEIFTMEQASKLAGMDQLRFQQILGERRIPLHYSKKDFEDDLRTLSELGRI
jgi:predicted HTH domain antitoxin